MKEINIKDLKDFIRFFGKDKSIIFSEVSVNNYYITIYIENQCYQYDIRGKMLWYNDGFGKLSILTQEFNNFILIRNRLFIINKLK